MNLQEIVYPVYLLGDVEVVIDNNRAYVEYAIKDEEMIQSITAKSI